MEGSACVEEIFEIWLNEVKNRHELQCKNINILLEAKHLDENGFRSLDSTLKKLTSFMKKLKNIGTTVSLASLLLDLDKLNLSNFLDEIAANICETKIKISDVSSLVEFCVKVSSLYSAFADHLSCELKKHLPCRRVTVINPSKLRVDLRFLAELVLHGVLKKDGVQLLGSTLSYVINNDKIDFVNATILLPFCRALFFDVTATAPSTQQCLAKKLNKIIPKEYSSMIFTETQKVAIADLFQGYFDSLVMHLNNVRLEMNRLQKSIKRQERTKGDASTEDRQKFDQIKNNFDRLIQNAAELAECLGYELPHMVEEPSDDEIEDLAAKKIDNALADGKLLLWPDLDTQMFYEELIDIRQLQKNVSIEGKDEYETNYDDDFDYAKLEIVESVNNVDLTNLDNAEDSSQINELDDIEDEEDNVGEYNMNDDDVEGVITTITGVDILNQDTPVSFKDFLLKLTVCVNRSFVDKAAIDFVSHFNKKVHRKRLVQHLLNPPLDRFDLLPFYACFIATIKPVLPDVTTQVAHELLRTFREYAKRPLENKKSHKRYFVKSDRQLHISNYISELVKFSLLPKAEALACFRSLLVDFRHYKIDMLCIMIESMGLFLYRSPESHAKMSVIMQVLRNKSMKIKDPRQQILIDNAYFSVIPPEDQKICNGQLPPIYEFLQLKIISAENRLNFFRKINWNDADTSANGVDFIIVVSGQSKELINCGFEFRKKKQKAYVKTSVLSKKV